MALSLILPSVTSTGEVTNDCTTSINGCNDQISFHTTALGNSTANSNLITTSSWSGIKNETMIITRESLTGDSVVSISDTASDSFTLRVHDVFKSAPSFIFDIWTGVFLGSTGSANSLTVQFSNESINSQNMVLVSTYLNVKSFGNSSSFHGTASSGSFPITTTQSGSWIVGGAYTSGQGGNSTCPQMIGTALVQRVHGCSIKEFPGIAISGDMEDNATALPNNNIFTYTERFDNNGGSGVDFQMGAIELIPIDKEPKNPNFNNFCTKTNGQCVTNQYKLNVAITNTAPNAVNKGLALNVAYCTGVTSNALVTTGANSVLLWGNYGGQALNQSNVKILIQFYISTNAPSTTFGVGLCATGGLIAGTSDLFLPVQGALNSNRTYSVAVNGLCKTNVSPCTSPATVYGWFEVTAQDFTLGSLGFDQICTQVYSVCNIVLQEQK